MVTSLGLSGWDAPEAVHEALMVEPVDVVGGDQLDVGQGVQRTASEG